MDYEQFNADNAAPPVDHWTGSAEGVEEGDARSHAGRVTSLVKLAKTVAAAVLLSAGISMAPGTAAAGQSPTDFIRVLGTQGLDVIRSNMTLNDKAVYFHQLLRQDFDLDGMSRFVLGPYWRVASEDQRQEFCRLFEDHLVRFYGEQLAQYGGESFRMTGSRNDPAAVIVTSQILRPQAPPIEVDWRLGVRDGLYKITDVAIDGVSMALTQRAEFASVIERNGAHVAVLLATMRE
jgi:phospholipid transport system substrate-binding protein